MPLVYRVPYLQFEPPTFNINQFYGRFKILNRYSVKFLLNIIDYFRP